MSREINLEEPLSEEDRQYLVERDQWRKIAAADGHGDPERAKREASARWKERRSPSAAPPQPPTVLAGDLTTPPAGDGDGGGDGGSLDEKPYDEWPYKALQEELKVRKQEALGEGMEQAQADELYKAGGSQADLVKRLEEDDERAAGQQ